MYLRLIHYGRKPTAKHQTCSFVIIKYKGCSGHTQGAFRLHLGNNLVTIREHSSHIPWKHSLGTFRSHSGNTPVTFREHSGNVQRTLRSHSGNIPVSFREQAHQQARYRYRKPKGTSYYKCPELNLSLPLKSRFVRKSKWKTGQLWTINTGRTPKEHWTTNLWARWSASIEGEGKRKLFVLWQARDTCLAHMYENENNRTAEPC
jgi:hypothetical protein